MLKFLAKILYTLVEADAKGIYNLGGEKKSIFDFVSTENINILPISKNSINEPVPCDISMDTTKLKEVLNDTTI